MSKTIPEVHTIDKSKTYVYEGVEVMLTGRTAQKRSTMSKDLVLTQYEVQPADQEGIQWKKWAKADDLYTISQE